MRALDFLRGIGNERFELARILWAASTVAGIVYAGAHLYLNSQFSIIEFGTGMGLLLAGGGGSVAIKDGGVARAKGGHRDDAAADD